MFKNIQKETLVDLLVFDNELGVPVKKSGLLSNITKRDATITIDTYPFDTITIPMSEIVSVKPKVSTDDMRSAIINFSKVSDKVNLKRKEYENAIDEWNKQKETLMAVAFLESYTTEGAVNFLNNIARRANSISIDENSISFRFVKTADGKIEVSIRASRRFEFYNTTKQSDIDKAADTYAPEIKDELKDKMSIFGNIFLVNRKSQKISDYLYESISEYNGEFDCTKENFFDRKKSFENMLKSF